MIQITGTHPRTGLAGIENDTQTLPGMGCSVLKCELGALGVSLWCGISASCTFPRKQCIKLPTKNCILY